MGTIDTSDTIEFKPVLQFNTNPPPSQSPGAAASLSGSASIRYSFTSADLRAHFLSSSDAAYPPLSNRRRSLSQPTALINHPQSPNPPQSTLQASNSSTSSTPSPTPSPTFHPPRPQDHPNPKSKKKSTPLLVPSPSVPSIFSMEGERDEVFAVGANYVTKMGETMEVYPWFFNFHGTIDIEDEFTSKISLAFKVFQECR